ncbi:IS5 family transposase [Streptomyces sp. NPDC059153]|uniref:IS5 family transposase n=1 Tax=Streptomyces sp. NPDC059153 TaxID=3346743 RepID=UPI00369C85F5
MTERRPYPSDLSDARWELIEPVLTDWRAERRSRALNIGRPPKHDLRTILDAILYVDRTGVQWRYLPHDFPPWETVYGYSAKWEKDGVFAQLSGLLRSLLREHEGRNAEPSACLIDAQSVKTSTSVPATSQGTDAGKKIVGRKRSIVTDTLGLLLAGARAPGRTPAVTPFDAVVCRGRQGGVARAGAGVCRPSAGRTEGSRRAGGGMRPWRPPGTLARRRCWPGAGG